MIKKAAALLVILATLGIASEASARPTCTIQGLSRPYVLWSAAPQYHRNRWRQLRCLARAWWSWTFCPFAKRAGRPWSAGLTQVADRVSEPLMDLSQCVGLAHGCHSRSKARMIQEKGEKKKEKSRPEGRPLLVIVPVEMEHVTGAQQVAIVSSLLRSYDGESLINMVMSWPLMPRHHFYG
jgi:hypothetical protein